MDSSSGKKKSILDTNIYEIQKNIHDMLELLDKKTLKSETALKKHFSHLSNTSPTLFNFILKNHDKQDRKILLSNINMMLSLVLKVQHSEVSLYDASAIVGQKIGEQYIPQLKNNNDN